MNLLRLLVVSIACGQCVYAPAQNLKSAEEILKPVSKTGRPVANYVVAYGKVLAKKASGGYIKFQYANGKVFAEIWPNGVKGTYLYDRSARFEGIDYSDGRRVRVVYSADGHIKAIQDGGPKVVVIRRKMKVDTEGKEKLAPFLTIQEGLSLLSPRESSAGEEDRPEPVCIEGSPEPCIVDAGDFGGADEPGGGGGGGGPGHEYQPETGAEPGGGGGGGSGVKGPTGTIYATVEECKREVCDDANSDMVKLCATTALTPESNRRCNDVAFRYYSNCLRSCGNGDWSWMDDFNYVW